jgi:hypothetical protein
MPVRLTELSVNESAFDVNLNPIRASLSIGMKILTVSDLPAGHRGADLYMAHLAQKERLAAAASGPSGCREWTDSAEGAEDRTMADIESYESALASIPGAHPSPSRTSTLSPARG